MRVAGSELRGACARERVNAYLREADGKRANVRALAGQEIECFVAVAVESHEVNVVTPRRVDEKVLIGRVARVLWVVDA